MTRVNFINSSQIYENTEKTFFSHKMLIKERLPEADVQHVGSSAIPNSLTKGDIDIQVRVVSDQFPEAVKVLSLLYKLNEGSVKTETFRAFKDDSIDPPLGVQLTIIDSEFDFFWKFRDVLLLNHQYRFEYDKLKKKYEGKEMDEYREAKNEFFLNMMKTPEFNKLK
ncbi:GrpB family protein [Bacillus salitolerans]|uniref:GrpB family protein n=1 Tax=Bacillus salitolerans TaxID=1437434 RepID=A0ABW4LRD0_9BACI